MADVPGGERRSPRADDSGDLDVAKVDRVFHYSPLCGLLGSLTGGFLIEGKNAPLEILFDRSMESFLELSPAPTRRK